jgi:hypothetical protein
MATVGEREAMTAAELRERIAADPDGGWCWRDAAVALAAMKARHPGDHMARAELFDMMVELLESARARQLTAQSRHEAALEVAEMLEFGMDAALAWARP